MLLQKKAENRQAGAELLGQLAGEYRIQRKIGTGGFGTVYEAEHPLLKRKAAVKVLHSNPSVDSIAVQRFIEEARSASQIRHRHIVDIFSFGTLPNGQYFYVMDLLEGAPLDRYLEQHGKFAPELALPLLRPVANAIDALHNASIVHRDLKPGNIFLAWESNGEVVPKLLDFGLVKLLSNPVVHTASGVPLGTPYYMSPEQCRGEKVDARADVYSFGVICYELFTGQVPFSGDSATAVLVAHVLQAPPRMSERCPELSSELDEAVLRMLSKDPAARPSSAGAALQELERAARSAGVTIGDALPWLPRPALERPVLPHSDTEPAESGMRGTQTGTDRSGSRGLWLGLALATALSIAALVRLTTSAPGGAPSPAATQPTAAVNGARPSAAAVKGVESAKSLQPGAAWVNGAQPSAAAANGVQPGAAALNGAQPGAASPNSTQPTASQPAVAAAPRQVELTLRGVPAGAAIMLGDQKLGEAPGPIMVQYGEQPLRLTVSAPNYGPKTIVVTPNAARDLRMPADKTTRRSKPAAVSHDLENPF
jgi:eukaryotic-like serine/threonine-protein kinase